MFPPFMYLIYCYNEEESFIKIGITGKSVKERFRKDMPYNYECIYEISGSSEFIWELEKESHKKFHNKRYVPVLEFGGKLECFDSEIIFDAINYFKNKNLEKIITNI